MRYIYIIALMTLATNNVYSQIGIGTETPVARSFHIDTRQNNTAALTVAQQTDDFIVRPDNDDDNYVRVGIGTAAPSTMLDIRSDRGVNGSPAFRLVDGTQAANRVLFSDGFGNASWGDSVFPSFINGTVPTGEVRRAILGIATDSHVAYTGMFIQLPPGFFLVTFTVKIESGDYINTFSARKFASVFLSTSNTTVDDNTHPLYTTPIQSVIIPQTYRHVPAITSVTNAYSGTGSIPIEVPDGLPQNFYVWVYLSPANFVPLITNNDPSQRIVVSNPARSSTYGPHIQLYATRFSPVD